MRGTLTGGPKNRYDEESEDLRRKMPRRRFDRGCGGPGTLGATVLFR